VGDVAGHAIWGQHQMLAWATGGDDPERTGAPGSPHPALIAGDEPLASWRAARAASVQALTPEAFARMTSITGIGEVPLVAVLSLLVTDTVAHTWDIGHALGTPPARRTRHLRSRWPLRAAAITVPADDARRRSGHCPVLPASPFYVPPCSLESVGSDTGAVPGLPRVRFYKNPPAEPDVRLSPHPALHVSSTTGVMDKGRFAPTEAGTPQCCLD
jgi:hypothetical protein